MAGPWKGTRGPDGAEPSRPDWSAAFAARLVIVKLATAGAWPGRGRFRSFAICSETAPVWDQVVTHVAERSDWQSGSSRKELILALAQSGGPGGGSGAAYRLAALPAWQNPTLADDRRGSGRGRVSTCLPESEKALLQTAAIIGKEFPSEVVRAVHRPCPIRPPGPLLRAAFARPN